MQILALVILLALPYVHRVSCPTFDAIKAVMYAESCTTHGAYTVRLSVDGDCTSRYDPLIKVYEYKDHVKPGDGRRNNDRK